MSTPFVITVNENDIVSLQDFQLLQELKLKRWNKKHRHSLEPSWELYKTVNEEYAVVDRNADEWFAIRLGDETQVLFLLLNKVPFFYEAKFQPLIDNFRGALNTHNYGI